MANIGETTWDTSVAKVGLTPSIGGAALTAGERATGSVVIPGASALLKANPSVVTSTGPTCLSIESAYGRFLYVSDLQDNTVSGFELDPHTGQLTAVLNTPFAAVQNPTCLGTAANGSHPIQSITP